MRRMILLAAILALLPYRAHAQDAPTGVPLGVSLPLFPHTPDPNDIRAVNWWNLDISAAPVDAKSPAFIKVVGGTTRALHPDFGGLVDSGDPHGGGYGFPYVVVNGVTNADLRTVQFDFSDESDGVDHNTDTSFPFYPIPDAAKTGFNWIEGGGPGTDPVDGDRHMLIIDKDHNMLYELYALGWDGTKWHAGSGAAFDLTSNARRPEGWTSADAAGLAITPGLVRYDEVFDDLTPIKHAFRVTVQGSNGYVYPASHDAGSKAGALPMGARFRLKPSVDVTTLTSDVHVQKIFQAMKTYGLIVADNGSNMFISGTFDPRWNAETSPGSGTLLLDDVISPAFRKLHASDFDVIELGWPPNAKLSVSDPTIVEGANGHVTNAVFDVTLSEPSTVPVTVSYATAPGTATSGIDYTAKAGSLTFAPGVTSKSVTIPVRGDALNEDDETFFLNVSNQHYALLDKPQGTATIQDDDPLPAVSITDASKKEGDAGLTNLLFNVSLSAPSGRTVTVDFATANDSAIAGTDYVATSGTLTFPPGQTKRTIAVPVIGNLEQAPTRTFTVDLTPTNADAGDVHAVGTILDDDPLPALAINDVQVVEGTKGQTTAMFTVTLTPAGTQTVTVHFASAPGTAAANSDYKSVAGTLQFPPGVTNEAINVPIVTDALAEKNEAFLVKLSSPAGAKIARAVGQAVIVDDDGAADPCTPIIAVPIVLDLPGTYCLVRALPTAINAGNAITIAADNVTVDLKGFTLSNTAGLATQANGIVAQDHQNVTVQNGTVQGFLVGVALTQSTPLPGALNVNHVKANQNHRVGLVTDGTSNTIVFCAVASTGGTTAFGAAADVYGIVARGGVSTVQSNTVTNTYPVGAGSAFGISLGAADGSTVTANTVTNAAVKSSVGITIDASTNVPVTNNVLTQLSYGIVFSNGATGSQTGNTFTKVTVPVTGLAGGRPLPLKLAAGQRYVVDQAGEPFLIHGEAPWSLIANLTNEDAELYLANRREKGVNALIVNLIEHKFAAHAPRDAYGDAPFTVAGDFSTPNAAYFAHADHVLQRAAANGMVVFLAPAYLGYNGGDEGWYQEMTANTPEALFAYGQFVGSRYKDYPNIVWLDGGDYDPADPSVVNQVAAGIKSVDTVHLHTAHTHSGSSPIDVWGSAGWLDLSNVYTYPENVNGVPVYERSDAEYARADWKPFFLAESTYEGEYDAPQWLIRQQAYEALLSGGTGQFFGNRPLWLFATGWQSAMNSRGSRDMVNVRQLFASRHWERLVPDTAHAFVTAGYGPGGPGHSVAALAADGSWGATYLPDARTVTVDLGVFAGVVQGRWYDPTNGTLTTASGSPFANTGTRDFTSPGPNATGTADWVLVFDRA